MNPAFGKGGAAVYFFDLDGTLLDSNGIWLDIDIAFLGRYHIDPVPADYTEYVTHHTFPDAAAYTRDRFRLPLSPEEIAAAWQEMARRAYGEQLELKPGARDFLLRARGAGIPCALLTSCMPALCRAALERHGLTGLLSPVLTTAELGLEKGDPALYRRVAGAFGLPPEDCALFDDSPVACGAARAAGWQVFGVADPIFAPRGEELARICGPGRFPFAFSDPLPLF